MVNLPEMRVQPEISLFAHLCNHFGDRIQLFDCTKVTLVHVSHTLEDTILREQMPAVLLTGFQESSHWRAETERYRALAEIAQQVCIFAGGTLGPEAHEREIRVTLGGADPLRQEWFVCALTPRFAAVLCGQDQHKAVGEEANRQFSTFWSFDPDVVNEVLDLLEGVVAYYRPERLAELQATRRQLPPIQPDARIMSMLMREFVRFEDTLQRAIRQREAQYQIISELATDYIYSIRVSPAQELAHEWASDALARWAGYSLAQMNDSSGWARIIHPDDRTAVEHQLSTLLSGHESISEFRILSQQGEIRWVRNYARPRAEPGSGRVYEIVGAASDITGQKMHEAALRVERDRFVKIVETAPGVVHAFRLSPDGAISFPYASARIADIYGLPPEALAKDAAPAAALWHPDDVGHILAGVEVSRQHMTPWRDEFRVLNPTRGELWIEGHSIPQREADGGMIWYGVLTDITERKQAEQALARSNQRLKILFDASNAFIAVGLNEQAILDQVAQTTTTLLGNSCTVCLSSNDGARAGVVALYDPDPEKRDMQRRLLGGMSSGAEAPLPGDPIFQNSQPSLYPRVTREALGENVRPELLALIEALGIHSMLAVPLRVPGRILGTLSLCRYAAGQPPFTPDDLTLAQDLADRAALALSNARLLTQLQAERATLARRVEERTADLSIANAELARTARLKDEFLASMSHELRTPLNSILGRSEALQEEIYGALTQKQVETLRGIEASGRHLLALINDILDLSKIEADALDLQIEPVLLDLVCRSALQMVAQVARRKRIVLSSTIDSLVETLPADERRLKQVLVNLLSNAVKFTPEGGKVGLEVLGEAAQQRVTFTVWDTGIGIAQEDLPRLFKPFVQIDSRLNRQFEGTGLGLALVLRLVQAHGGSVAVASTPGQGSRFSVTLPWDAQQQQAAPESAERAGAAPALPLRQALVVEDSQSAAEQIQRYLGDLGARAELHTLAGGAIARARELQPDLIMLDILLPDAVGWELLRQLKAEPRTRNIPVIIVSVVDEPERARALGAAAFLVKPIGRATFLSTLQRLGYTVAAAGEHGGGQAVARAAPKILLAEDNQATIDVMEDYLQAKGYEVVVARNGAEALAHAQEAQPALILMDIQMPGMDGLEAIGRLRADEQLRGIPIIAVTALAMPGDRERCLAAGADDYLTKPVNLRALLATIQTHLKSAA